MDVDFNTLISNYASKNAVENPCDLDWCVSPVLIQRKTPQVKIDLGDRSYDYVCRYKVEEGDVAIIGQELPVYSCYDNVKDSPNSGKIGIVKEVFQKVTTINRYHAFEVAFVFTPTTTKENIRNCIKYLNFGPDDYERTLQLNRNFGRLRPVSYFIRKILSAASILAHKDITSIDNIEIARAEIHSKKCLDYDMRYLYFGPPGEIGMNFTDIQVPNSKALNELKIKRFDSNRFYNNGVLEPQSGILNEVIESEEINAYIQKYAHFGAISIMVRGGFKNLLEAYLSENPPIEMFYDEICDILRDVGYKEAYDLLLNFKH